MITHLTSLCSEEETSRPGKAPVLLGSVAVLRAGSVALMRFLDRASLLVYLPWARQSPGQVSSLSSPPVVSL